MVFASVPSHIIIITDIHIMQYCKQDTYYITFQSIRLYLFILHYDSNHIAIVKACFI